MPKRQQPRHFGEMGTPSKWRAVLVDQPGAGSVSGTGRGALLANAVQKAVGGSCGPACVDKENLGRAGDELEPEEKGMDDGLSDVGELGELGDLDVDMEGSPGALDCRRKERLSELLVADAERKGRIARLQAVVFTLEKLLIATEGEERDEVGAPPPAEEGDAASEPRRMSGASGSCVKRRRRIGTDS